MSAPIVSASAGLIVAGAGNFKEDRLPLSMANAGPVRAADDPSGVTASVRDELMAHFRDGRTGLEQIAGFLGLSPRTLQWRLQQEGTSFDKVRDDTRRRLAQYYLIDTDRPMVEISHELGFSEQSAFCRAAQRWFGTSPKLYRRQHRVRMARSVFG